MRVKEYKKDYFNLQFYRTGMLLTTTQSLKILYLSILNVKYYNKLQMTKISLTPAFWLILVDILLKFDCKVFVKKMFLYFLKILEISSVGT